ncbi:MAG: ABC transporter substrate-binding protein, partial [Acidobacteriota bacterium]
RGDLVIDRRSFAKALALSLLGVSAMATAQTTQRLPVVGVLTGVSDIRSPSIGRVLRGLSELGYVEGKNFTVEFRSAAGKPAAFPAYAAELVARKVDVIYAMGPAAVNAARAATRVIPIVALDFETDPVQAGWAGSLARPGGNLTGTFLDNSVVAGKWIELLRVAAPGLRRVGLLWDSSTGSAQLLAAKAAAQGFGIETQVMEVKSTGDVETALRAGMQAGIGAIVVLSSPELSQPATIKQIVDFAARNRLPSIALWRVFPDKGGLMSYGHAVEIFSPRAGVLIGKILNGAKPGDLAIELPTKFELVINLKTAKALGITIPQALRLRADEVIQ